MKRVLHLLSDANSDFCRETEHSFRMRTTRPKPCFHNDSFRYAGEDEDNASLWRAATPYRCPFCGFSSRQWLLPHLSKTPGHAAGFLCCSGGFISSGKWNQLGKEIYAWCIWWKIVLMTTLNVAGHDRCRGDQSKL